MPLNPQDHTPNPEVTAPRIANLVALLSPPQDLHIILRHPARFPHVTHLLLTLGLIAPTASHLVLTIRVVVASFLSISGVTKLPNNHHGPPKEIRPKRLSMWLPQCLMSRSAEMSMVMVICQLRRQAPNPLFSHHHRHTNHLITPLHYR
jgi:hypothetical protein